VLVQLDGPERSLNGVREISSDPVLLQAAAEKLVEMGGITARLGHHILGLQDKERSGVLSTVGRHLAFLDSEPVARVVAVAVLIRNNSAGQEPRSISAFRRTSLKRSEACYAV